jgi:uncharacterized membrane protein
MKKLEEIRDELDTKGGMTRKVVYGAVFFAMGLLFILLGFWKTLLLVAITLVGVALGSTDNVVESVKSLINRLLPQTTKAVIYTAEDKEKVQRALEKKDKANAGKAAADQDKAKADKATEDEGE